jgi:hypothetical protein
MKLDESPHNSANYDKPKWVVTSPDGIPIDGEHTSYDSYGSACYYLGRWVSRYTPQGYYRTANGGHIPLDEIVDHCRLFYSPRPLGADPQKTKKQKGETANGNTSNNTRKLPKSKSSV